MSAQDELGLVALLNKWADVLTIPSGDFVNEDLRRVATALTSLIAERDAAKGKLALLIDRVVYSDSYGVPGSDFTCCSLCTGGGAPGIPFEHDPTCPVKALEADYETWFDSIKETEDALFQTEQRATTAEAQLKAAREVIEWASRQQRKPYGVTVAIDALSLDSNKGDGV